MRRTGLRITALLILAALQLFWALPAAGENPDPPLFEKHTTFSEQTGKEITWWLYIPRRRPRKIRRWSFFYATAERWGTER